MDGIRLDLLTLLADRAEVWPTDKSFDLAHWVAETPCGTACCLIGLAAELPEFQAEGLTLTRHNGVRVPRVVRHDEEYLGLFAAGALFNLPEEADEGGASDAFKLFGKNPHITLPDAVARLRAYVKEHLPPAAGVAGG